MDRVYVLGLDRELDAEARVERLVREHEAKLTRYVTRFTGERDLARDIVQDVFFAAYRLLRDEPIRPLSAGWLYKTATTRALSHVRRAKRRGETIGLAGPGAIDCSDDGTAAHIDLQRALATLRDEQLACVLLTTYAGYSSAEAALILGMSADAVRQRVCRAMRDLRRALGTSA